MDEYLNDAKPADENSLIEKVKEMREMQKRRDKTLVWGWRCKARLLEDEVDNLLSKVVGQV